MWPAFGPPTRIRRSYSRPEKDRDVALPLTAVLGAAEHIHQPRVRVRQQPERGGTNEDIALVAPGGVDGDIGVLDKGSDLLLGRILGDLLVRAKLLDAGRLSRSM